MRHGVESWVELGQFNFSFVVKICQPHRFGTSLDLDPRIISDSVIQKSDRALFEKGGLHLALYEFFHSDEEKPFDELLKRFMGEVFRRTLTYQTQRMKELLSRFSSVVEAYENVVHKELLKRPSVVGNETIQEVQAKLDEFRTAIGNEVSKLEALNKKIESNDAQTLENFVDTSWGDATLFGKIEQIVKDLHQEIKQFSQTVAIVKKEKIDEARLRISRFGIWTALTIGISSFLLSAFVGFYQLASRKPHCFPVVEQPALILSVFNTTVQTCLLDPNKSG